MRIKQGSGTMDASPRPVITDKGRQPASFRVARFGSSPGATLGMLLCVQKVSQATPPPNSAPITTIKGIQASSSTNLKLAGILSHSRCFFSFQECAGGGEVEKVDWT